MTIKKPMKTAASTAPAAPAPSGAAIASRLRLDAPEPSAQSGEVPGIKPAFGVALVALGITAVLVYTLWKHWEFLMPA